LKLLVIKNITISNIPVKKAAFIDQKFCLNVIGFAFKLFGEGLYRNKKIAYKKRASKNKNIIQT
jgi:uncharacterized membrane protein YGL010W